MVDYVARTIRRKYFDYFVFNIVDSSSPRPGARHRALAQTINNARGLDIASPLRFHQHRHSQATRRSQQRSGARHRLAPAILSTSALASNAAIPTTLGGSTSPRPCDFVDIGTRKQRDDPNDARGSTTTSSPIVVVILRQQLTYLYIVDYGRADQGALDKS
jgi:hypothetical protein